jgi:nucleotidyltransferase AbiEii toxin of type IV toxin-antitoxin system
MFLREQHRNVVSLLAAFAERDLSGCKFFFGGGTRVVLDLEEYRESRDIDFLCSDAEGYADLRFQAATRGYDALFRPDGREKLNLPREMRIDQYGIRFPVEFGASLIRVELIREARIALDPGIRPDWSSVDCLTLTDCYAEKILANSDRWADRQILSRDLIDLSFLRKRIGPVPERSWEKTERAYRSAARVDLVKAIAAFIGDARHQKRCFEGLQVEHPEEALAGMDLLRRDLETTLPHPPR